MYELRIREVERKWEERGPERGCEKAVTLCHMAAVEKQKRKKNIENHDTPTVVLAAAFI